MDKYIRLSNDICCKYGLEGVDMNSMKKINATRRAFFLAQG